MGEVVKLPRRPRRPQVRAASHAMLAEAFRVVGDPSAVVMVVLGADGQFAVRSVSNDKIQDFDKYSRAGAIIDRERLRLLD